MKKSLIIIIISCFLCSCTNVTSNKNMERNSEQNIVRELSIYRMGYNDLIEEAVVLYRNEYPDMKINEVVIDEYEQYKQKIFSELMVGDGPDIVLFNQWTFNSIYKTSSTGIFADLQPIIEEDQFDLAKYNKVVMDSGIIDGKRYFIPINYYVPLFWTTSKILNDNNIEYNKENWTWNSFLEQSIKVKNKNSEGYFIGGEGGNIISFIGSSGYKIFDYDKKEAYFDTEQFTQILKLYKKINDISLPNEIYIKYGHKK